MKNKTYLMALTLGLLVMTMGLASAVDYKCDTSKVDFKTIKKPSLSKKWWASFWHPETAKYTRLVKLQQEVKADMANNRKPRDVSVTALIKDKAIEVRGTPCEEVFKARNNNYQPSSQETQDNPIPAPEPIPCIPVKCENGYKGQVCCDDPREK